MPKIAPENRDQHTKMPKIAPENRDQHTKMPQGGRAKTFFDFCTKIWPYLRISIIFVWSHIFSRKDSDSVASEAVARQNFLKHTFFRRKYIRKKYDFSTNKNIARMNAELSPRLCQWIKDDLNITTRWSRLKKETSFFRLFSSAHRKCIPIYRQCIPHKTRILMSLFYELLSKRSPHQGYVLTKFRKIKSSK